LPKRVDVVSLVCLGAAVLLWGTSFTAMKAAIAGFPPMAVVWMRMAIGSLIMLPFWRRVPRPRYETGDWKWLLLLGLMQPCLYYLFEGYAIQLTTSAQAGMISAIVPLLVAAGAALFLSERLPGAAIFGLLMSVAGVVVLSLAGAPAAHAPAPVLGNALELLAMVSAAVYMLVVKRLSTRYDPWLLTGLQALAGVVFFLPGALLSNPAAWLSVPASAWIGTLYLGCFVTLGGFGLYNMAVARMDAGRAAMSINLIPWVAVATGWIVLGEALRPIQAVACATIIGGVLLGELGAPRSVHADPVADLGP
jgi:drug/metabolite transporter (DMT)-like permease